MVEKLPPQPWTYQTNALAWRDPGSGIVYLLDANGRRIGTTYGSPDEKIAVVEFICDVSGRVSIR